MPWVREHWRAQKGQGMAHVAVQPTLFDVPADPCARKSGGDRQSRAAFQAVERESQVETVYEEMRALHQRTGRGVTLDELSCRMGVAPNRISGRISQKVYVPTGGNDGNG